MKVGIDLDNTLADYSRPLTRLCLEHGIPVASGHPRKLLREEIGRRGCEADWTRLQGMLYGPWMQEAELAPGFRGFLERATLAGATCLIVSHRTRVPLLGEPHDLHAAARAWLASVGLEACTAHLEETRAAKIQRIASLQLDVFIDDLPQVLDDPGFPAGTRRILFDPAHQHGQRAGMTRATTWESIGHHVFGASA